MRRKTVPLIAVFILSACGGYGPWRIISENGPKIAGVKEAVIQERCAGPQPMSDVIRCETAILDSSGRRVSLEPSMQELEKFLPQVSQIAPWITLVNGPNKGPGPYKLYLVSVMPAIVVAVSERSSTDWYCWYSPLQNGCMQSKALNLNSYWFRAEPKIAQGSFWFSPQKSGGAVPIDASEPTVEIKVEGVDITFAAIGGFWVRQSAR